MITGLVRFFYPDIKKEEVKKFGILAIALFFILGTYWIIRLLKDVLIYELAFPEQFWGTADYGRRFIATLKPISVITVLCTTFLYAKLVDTFKKHQLFYVIISFYVAFFSIVTAVVLAMNTFGVEAIGKWPLAITGTAAYLVTETYGSLVVALFWSFTVSSSTSDQAKRCYPFIITVAQIGTILGASLVRWNLPDEVLFGLCLMSLTAVMLTIRYFVANVPAEKEAQSGKEEA